MLKLNRSIVAALFVIVACLTAGCASTLTAIANTPARFGNYKVTRNVAYAKEAPRQRLDVYQPTAPANAPRPVVIFVYGGSWQSGSKSSYRFVADTLTAHGYVAVLPDYRLYSSVRFPDFVFDVAAAVAWTQQHAAELGGDPNRIFLMGHSAGAHIGALIALDDEYLAKFGGKRTALAGFIGLAGPYDFIPFEYDYLRDIFGPPEHYPQSQPINYVTKDAPPLLLLHGEADTLVYPSNSKHLAARMRRVGGRVEEHYFEQMSHGDILGALSVYYRNGSAVVQDIDHFIREHAATEKPQMIQAGGGETRMTAPLTAGAVGAGAPQ